MLEQRQRCDECKKKLFRIMINEKLKITSIVCNNCGKINLKYKNE